MVETRDSWFVARCPSHSFYHFQASSFHTGNREEERITFSEREEVITYAGTNFSIPTDENDWRLLVWQKQQVTIFKIFLTQKTVIQPSCWQAFLFCSAAVALMKFSEKLLSSVLLLLSPLEWSSRFVMIITTVSQQKIASDLDRKRERDRKSERRRRRKRKTRAGIQYWKWHYGENVLDS